MPRLIKQHGRLARRLLANRANPTPITMLFWQLLIKKKPLSANTLHLHFASAFPGCSEMDNGLDGRVYRVRPGGWPAISNDDPEVCQQLISPRAARKRHASRNLLPLKALHSDDTSQHLSTLSPTSRYAGSRPTCENA